MSWTRIKNAFGIRTVKAPDLKERLTEKSYEELFNEFSAFYADFQTQHMVLQLLNPMKELETGKTVAEFFTSLKDNFHPLAIAEDGNPSEFDQKFIYNFHSEVIGMFDIVYEKIKSPEHKKTILDCKNAIETDMKKMFKSIVDKITFVQAPKSAEPRPDFEAHCFRRC